MAQNQNYIDQQKILQTDLVNWSDYITKVNNYIDVTNSNMTQI